ncbi:MAG: 50S ribosomal protein L25 [Gorillibacterium sp.]|nr:50S ribosomal protein L25 [Gorillibacterium sp.]
MAIRISAQVRTGKSGSAIHNLRSSGNIPASVYGRKIDGGESISVVEKELGLILRKNPHAVIQLDIAEQGNYPVMINEIQRDKVSGKVLHVDFHQISMDELVKSIVGIELTGDSPGVKEGGILSVETHEIEIRCLPANLPPILSIDISGLHVGDNVLVSDLDIPEGIELLTDSTSVVVTILAPQKEIVEESDEVEVPVSEVVVPKE